MFGEVLRLSEGGVHLKKAIIGVGLEGYARTVRPVLLSPLPGPPQCEDRSHQPDGLDPSEILGQMFLPYLLS